MKSRWFVKILMQICDFASKNKSNINQFQRTSMKFYDKYSNVAQYRSKSTNNIKKQWKALMCFWKHHDFLVRANDSDLHLRRKVKYWKCHFLNALHFPEIKGSRFETSGPKKDRGAMLAVGESVNLFFSHVRESSFISRSVIEIMMLMLWEGGWEWTTLTISSEIWLFLLLLLHTYSLLVYSSPSARFPDGRPEPFLPPCRFRFQK